MSHSAGPILPSNVPQTNVPQSQPSPPPSATQSPADVHVVATDITAQNKVRVTLSNGRTYEITAHLGQKDLSRESTPAEWVRIYEKIFQYFATATGKNNFVSAQITLRGDSPLTSAADLERQNVRIVGNPSAIVYDGARGQQSITLPEKVQSIAFNQLEQLADDNYRRGATVAPVVPSATAVQYEESIQDTRLDICKNRPHSVVKFAPPAPAAAPAAPAVAPGAPPAPQVAAPPPPAVAPAAPAAAPGAPPAPQVAAPPPPAVAPAAPAAAPAPQQPPPALQFPSAHYALADQLSKMPSSGQTQWNGQPVDTIAEALINEIKGFIAAKLNGPVAAKQQWIASNIKDISESLNAARLSDSDRHKLMEALDIYNNKRSAAISGFATTQAALDALFTDRNLSVWTPDQKEMLVNIYLEYISVKRCKFFGPTFFKMFVEIHQQQDKQDHFQVVLIIEGADGKEYAKSFPDGTGTIETDRCAFIHVDAQGKYSSYNRTANVGAGLSDLNVKKSVNPTPQVTTKLRSPIATASSSSPASDSSPASVPPPPATSVAPPPPAVAAASSSTASVPAPDVTSSAASPPLAAPASSSSTASVSGPDVTLIAPPPPASSSSTASDSSPAPVSPPAATLVASPLPAAVAAPIPSLETVNLDLGGRCLDMSIAYLMLEKGGVHKVEICNSKALLLLANTLRTGAASLIQDEKENGNDIFYENLMHSISEIPAFSLNQKTTPENKNSSSQSLKKLNYSEAANDIIEINKIIEYKITIIGLTSEQKKTLKRFYSNFIIQEDKGKYFNFLDLAFLHVLPKLDISFLKILLPNVQTASIPPKIECAIVNGNKIYAKFDGDSKTEFNSDSTLFVEYDGLVHYKAIDMTNSNTKKKIDSFIDEWKNDTLGDLLKLDSAKEIKRRLTEEIQYSNPQAYTAFCRLIWKHFHDEWAKENVGNYGAPALDHEPGRPHPYVDIALQEGKTIRSLQTSVVLDVRAYGNWKLNELSPDELKKLITSEEFDQTKITEAMKDIFLI